MSTKGMAAPETLAALEQARLFIEGAEALGEPVGNPQQLLVLNGSGLRTMSLSMATSLANSPHGSWR